MSSVTFKRVDNGTRNSSRTLTVEKDSGRYRILSRSKQWREVKGSERESEDAETTEAARAETTTTETPDAAVPTGDDSKVQPESETKKSSIFDSPPVELGKDSK